MNAGTQTPTLEAFMPRSFYTVTITRASTQIEEVSRFFNTIRAARNWAKWCRTISGTSAATIYRGEAGGVRVE